MAQASILQLHYSAPPVIGGVEAVIDAQTREMIAAGYTVTLIAGRGEVNALPEGAQLVQFQLLDSQHPDIVAVSTALEKGEIPIQFETLTQKIAATLEEQIHPERRFIVHNVFTKHFNLPLTAALHRLIDAHPRHSWIAWCHDFSWTSPGSRAKMHSGYPWDLLRAYRSEITYVTVSKARQVELAGLIGCPEERIHVVYNGVEPESLLGLSSETEPVLDRFGLLDADLILLMPVRVTRAKNIEFALEVAKQLVDRGLRLKLLVIGPPDPHDSTSMAYFHELQDKRDSLRLAEHAHFVYELEDTSRKPLVLTSRGVGDLYRIADVVFIPSHREGFGIPVLEAGLVGAHVVSTPIPAAVEIGGGDISTVDLAESPDHTAVSILDWMQADSTFRLRRRVRQGFTWRSIFHRSIAPIL